MLHNFKNCSKVTYIQGILIPVSLDSSLTWFPVCLFFFPLVCFSLNIDALYCSNFFLSFTLMSTEYQLLLPADGWRQVFPSIQIFPFQWIPCYHFTLFFGYWNSVIFPSNPGKYSLILLLILLPILFMRDFCYLQFFLELYIQNHIQTPFFSNWNYFPAPFIKSRFLHVWVQ